MELALPWVHSCAAVVVVVALLKMHVERERERERTVLRYHECTVVLLWWCCRI